MAEVKKYRIRVTGTLIEVSKEVYLTYYRMDRRARYLEEKDTDHGTALYSNMDTEEMIGEEMIPDTDSPSVEEMALDMVMNEKLRKCMLTLTIQELELVDGLFFQELSERQFAFRTKTPLMTIHNRKVRILRKLKNLMEK